MQVLILFFFYKSGDTQKGGREEEGRGGAMDRRKGGDEGEGDAGEGMKGKGEELSQGKTSVTGKQVKKLRLLEKVNMIQLPYDEEEEKEEIEKDNGEER